MKVLFFSHQSEFMYGGEICTLAFMRELKRVGVEVYFAAPLGPYFEEAKKIAKTFPVESEQFRRDLSSLAKIPKLFYQTSNVLAEIVDRERIDIIHVTSLKAMAYFLFSPRANIIWHHHDILPKRWDNDLWLRLLAARAKKILVPSLASLKEFHRLGITKALNLYNGFPPDGWIIKRPKQAGEKFVVGMVGEISQRKGADRWEPIVANFYKSNPNIEFHVIGEGLSDVEFSKEVKKGLSPYPVKFFGRRSDMKERYAELDCILVLSQQDPLPTVIIEAGFSGVPAIGTKVGGIPELIADGKTGFLIDTNEEAINCLAFLENIENWKKISQEVQKRMREKFSIENLTKKLVLQYQELINSR